MNVLKWLNNIGPWIATPRPATPAPRHLSAQGNAIEPEWHSQWMADACGFHETRCHVGRSSAGYHAGIEVCRREGMGRIEWHEARPSPEMARAESGELQNACREKIPCCIGERRSGCCLYSKADAGVEMALLGLHEIVAKIENDPAQNWPRYHPDFERAVVGLSRSITALWVRQGQAMERGVER
jgi:hypothetical protein